MSNSEVHISWYKGKHTVNSNSLLAGTAVELRSQVHANEPDGYSIFELLPKFLHVWRGYKDVPAGFEPARQLPPLVGRYRSAGKWELPDPKRDDGKRTYVARIDGAQSFPITSVGTLIKSRRSTTDATYGGDNAEVSGHGIKLKLPAIFRRNKNTVVEYVFRKAHDPWVEIELLQGNAVAEHLARLELQWGSRLDSDETMGALANYGYLMEHLPNDTRAYFADRPVGGGILTCRLGPRTPITLTAEVGHRDDLRAVICAQIRDLESGSIATTEPMFFTSIGGQVIITDLPASLVSQSSVRVLQSYKNAGGNREELALRQDQDIETVGERLRAAVDEIGADSLDDAVALISDGEGTPEPEQILRPIPAR
jgi:hypothetical protein